MFFRYFVAEKETFEILCLDYDTFSDHDFKYADLDDILKLLKKVRVRKLKILLASPIFESEQKALIKALKGRRTRLELFCKAKEWLKPEPIEKCFVSFAAQVLRIEKLTSLKITFVRYSDYRVTLSEFRDLCRELAASKLNALKIMQWRLAPEECELLFSSLNRVKSLSLYMNGIGDYESSAKAFTDFLRKAPLRKLRIRENCLSHRMREVADALVAKASLRALCFRDACIALESVAELARLLQNTSLKKLHFEDRQSPRADLTPLFEALKRNTTLTDLCIEYKSDHEHASFGNVRHLTLLVTQETIKGIEQHLAQVTRLKSLVLIPDYFVVRPSV